MGGEESELGEVLSGKRLMMNMNEIDIVRTVNGAKQGLVW